jgi:serine/threonine-protein kinase
VFVGQREGVQQLYVRDLTTKDARALDGTEGAQVPTLSPDGEWVAFWADTEIRKVRLSGGPVAVVGGDLQLPPVGMSWRRDGRLFLGNCCGSILQLSPEGALEPVTTLLENEISHGLPHLLPRGDALLFTARKRIWSWGDDEVVAHRLATGERKFLLRDAADARYVRSGHLVFLRRGVLFAVAFDAMRLEVGGEPVPLLDDVAQALVGGEAYAITGAGQLDVAPDGTLAYLEGGVAPHLETSPVSIDRQGRVSVVPAPPRPYTAAVRISPDGQRLALGAFGLTEMSLWIHDIARGTLSRLTSDVEAGLPTWSPDGERVVFMGVNDGVWELMWQRTEGTEPPETLAQAKLAPPSWTPDGERFAVVRWTGRANADISVGTLEGSKATLRPLLQTPFAEMWPEVSPDGRWLAYVSNESGRNEVYVQPFPGPGPRTQVSVNGGISPAWNPAGGELFFVTPPDPDRPETRHMMVVPVHTHPTFRVGAPRPLFRISPTDSSFWGIPARCYGVSADGQRFFAIREGKVPPPPSVTQIHLVQNWLEEVKARVPTDR